MDIEIRKFTAADYMPYKSWFADKHLADTLGGVDADWLEHVLVVTDSAELAIYSNNEMVSVVGVVFPDAKNRQYVISNIAVKPGRTGNGIGSIVLEIILNAYDDGTRQNWVCFIEPSNSLAQKFFEKNGWKNCGAIQPGNMLKFLRAS